MDSLLHLIELLFHSLFEDAASLECSVASSHREVISAVLPGLLRSLQSFVANLGYGVQLPRLLCTLPWLLWSITLYGVIESSTPLRILLTLVLLDSHCPVAVCPERRSLDVTFTICSVVLHVLRVVKCTRHSLLRRCVSGERIIQATSNGKVLGRWLELRLLLQQEVIDC